MSDRDLRKLYENVRRGDEYVAPKRESDLYQEMISSDILNTYEGRADLIAVKVTDGEQEGQIIYLPRDIVQVHGVSGDQKDSVYNAIVKALKAKNYSNETLQPGHFDGLVAGIVKNDPAEFIKFVSTSGDREIKAKGNHVGDLASFLTPGGFSKEAMAALVSSKWTDAGGSNIGPGEIALALTFGDVSNKVVKKLGEEGDESDTTGGDLLLTIDGQSAGEGFFQDIEMPEGDAPIEIKGQDGRFGQQPGREPATDSILNHIFNGTFPSDVDDPAIYTDFGLNANKQTVDKAFISVLKSAYGTVQALEASDPGVTERFIESVSTNLLQAKYPEAGTGAYNDVFQSLASGDEARLKHAMIKCCTYNYMNIHKYNFLMFIEKEPPFKYAMLAGNTLVEAIDNNRLITSTGFGKRGFAKGWENSGFKVGEYYPNMRYVFA